MATITDFADRTSSGNNTTVTLTPDVGDNFDYNVFVESQPAFQITVVEWSADAGVNFFNPVAAFTFFPDASQLGVRTGIVGSPDGVINTPINMHLNNGSRFRYTTPANVGTYIISSIGFIIAT